VLMHTCNPRYSGGEGWRMTHLIPTHE
jgi:hypothetical protein